LQKRCKINALKAELLVDICTGHLAQRVAQCLNLGRINAILAIGKLDNVHTCITHSAIMLHKQILHTLHHLTLNVTRIGRLHSCVNQTLTTRHGVEEELLRCQTTNE
jgi:hypothetical protein